MNPVKWQKIKEIFNEAIELDTRQRVSFVDSACADDPEMLVEVNKLLAEDVKDETLFDPFIAPISLAISTNPLGAVIGKYRVIKEIGEGGMGSVYLAERDDLGNKVALKIVKRGMDTVDLLRRFKTEQQILAGLEHPNIARLLDNGTTDDGLPYYVMEYVEGESLLRFVNRNEFSTKQRLEIFRKICAAVQYAHNRLVVHRDLKPSNILVSRDNEPKLLDFGIAKLLNPNKIDVKGTATLLGMMTPNYASPEQFRGETVTTASDVYSLGVILYELMTGFLPFDFNDQPISRMLEIVSTTEPRTPSATVNPVLTKRNFSPQLKGDLDNIILKALKKEPDRRYLSAEQFSEDIRRHLEGLPVRARPDTFGYRASKFIKRNKLKVAAGILLALSLVGGIIGTTYQRNRAERRFDDLRGLSNRLIFKYNDAISNLPGATATRAALVQEATQFLDSLASEDTADAKLQFELASAYLKVGDLQHEIPIFEPRDNLETYRKSLGIAEKLVVSDEQNAEYQSVYAAALRRVGGMSKNAEYLNKAVSIRENILQKDAENVENKADLVESYSELGLFLHQNQENSATEYLEKAVKLGENLVNEPTATSQEWRLFAKTNAQFATILAAKPAEAIVYQDKAVQFYQKVLDNKPNLILAKQELAIELLNRLEIYKTLNKNDLAANDKQKALEMLANLIQFDPKNDILQRLVSRAKGEKNVEKDTPQLSPTETQKDDIFKK